MAESIPQPQFEGGGPFVLVRNTFLDIDDRPPDPSALLRAKTAPPRSGGVVEDEEDEDEEAPVEVAPVEVEVAEDAEGPQAPNAEELRRIVTCTESWFEEPEEWGWAGDEGRNPQTGMCPGMAAQAPTMMGPGPGPMSYASSAPMQQQHSGGQMPMQMVLMPVAMGPMGMGSGAEGLSGIASAPSVPPSAAELAVRLPDRGARWPQGICGPAPVGPLRGPAGLGQQAPSAPGGIVIMQGEIPHMGVPGLCGGGGGAAIGAPPLAPQPQTLTRAFSVKSGFFRVHWTVDARKLRGNDKQAVSPPFELSFGSQFPNVTFKMMIYPKAVSDSKGGASFKKARGHGYVQLKCEAELSEAIANVAFRISIGSGDKMQPPRGPVAHNFSSSAVCGLPKEQEEWDFESVKDTDSMTFVVCLEIVPRSGGI
eukprot:CAMPEP_0115083666 /NCGR_PEP_ID=MMETSP0227-20121206/20719_1 /TAXON_ID=89957 /ORGANISM="Polarella glacialis, Strain CCMP 1383" /LENGTH=422 /DNA_ID=CAMNT_0002472163 /DNA_START=59 /DNA_END=1327 /DNA_ORIENTATION=+